MTDSKKHEAYRWRDGRWEFCAGGRWSASGFLAGRTESAGLKLLRICLRDGCDFKIPTND